MSALGLFALLLLPSTAGAQDEDLQKNFTVQQIDAYKARPKKQSSLQVTAVADRSDLVYARGDKLKLRIRTNEDAYVTVFNVGPKGKVTQLFPNRYQQDNLIKANREAEIPSAESKSEINISGDLGGEVIKVFATSQPLKVLPEGIVQSDQVFMTVKSSVPEMMRDLEVTAEAPSAPQKISVVNMAIKTVASRN